MDITTSTQSLTGPYIALPAGYYYLTAKITIGPGQKLVGAGVGQTVLVAPTGTDECVLMSGASGWLEGMSIVRKSSAGGDAGLAVSVTGADCVLCDLRTDGDAGTATTGISASSAGDRTIMRNVRSAISDAGDEPTDGGIVAKVFSFVNAVAAGTNDIHALYDSATATTTTGFTNPDLPRNIVCVKAASWDGGTITVVGTDQYDRACSELFSATSAGTETGAQIFKTVTSMTKGTPSGVAGNGVSLGSGAKLGVKGKLVNTTEYVACQLGSTVEAATLNLTYDSVLFTTAPDGAKDFVLIANVRQS